jgi:hypothetical protein
LRSSQLFASGFALALALFQQIPRLFKVHTARVYYSKGTVCQAA